MQNVLRDFVKEMLTHKDLQGVEAEVVDQLVADLVERLNTQINRGIVAQLEAPDLKDFEALMQTKPSKTQINQFFIDKNVNTTAVATEIMQTFRQGYLGA